MAMSGEQAARLNEATKVIAVADVVESVRLMEHDEGAFIRRWQGFLGFVVEHLPRHAGRLHKSLGDGLMLEFSDPEACILAARAMHEWFGESNQDLGPEDHVHLRIGAHVARFVADAYDIYGNDVNLASRIASLAGPGEIVISAALRNRLGKELRTELEDLGSCHLKHVRAPVHAFRIGQAGRAPVVPAAGAGGPQPWRPLVAVLPFAVRGHGPEGATGDTLVDDIVAALTQAGNVQVVSRLSTEHLQRQSASLRTVRHELGAAYVLAGHVRRHGEKLALFAELCDARTGHVAWAHGFRADAQALGTADQRVAQAIAASAQSAIVAHETARAHAQALPALEGPTLLLAAIALMHTLGARDLDRAQAMLEHLAERWPRHPQAHAWLAHLHLLRWQQGGDPEAATQARADAARALQCDGGGALPLAMEGRVTAHIGGDLAAAQLRFAQALALHPGDSLALLCRAEVKALQGDGAGARADLARAGAALPLSPLLSLHGLVGAQGALAAGDAQDALGLAQRCVERSPSCLAAHCTLVAAQVGCGDVNSVRETTARFGQRLPDLQAGVARMPAGALRQRVEEAFEQLAP